MAFGSRACFALQDPMRSGGPGIIMLHGFGGTKDAPTHRLEAEAYAGMGYVVLQFDFRGCGASEGTRGRIPLPRRRGGRKECPNVACDTAGGRFGSHCDEWAELRRSRCDLHGRDR